MNKTHISLTLSVLGIVLFTVGVFTDAKISKTLMGIGTGILFANTVSSL